ncbi:AsmA family protein [Imbroritus primus]|uniref:AsmA family protein n=1 Tax=Imbroritus primus TaxID=3058603 RepID=UPI003D160A10
MKLIRTAAWTAAGVALMLLAGAAWIAVTFDPNDYKADLVALVEARTQRTLRIDGDLKLFFWPRLGADLGRTALSERRSATPFLSVEQARVSLAIWPLLRGRMVVDEVSLAGASVTLARDKNGRFNFDDLLSQSSGGGSESARVDLDIAGIRLKNGALVFKDALSGNTVQLGQLDLDTGRLTDGVRTPIALRTRVSSVLPAAALDLNLKTQLTFDRQAQRIALHGLHATAAGNALDIRGVDAAVSGDIALSWADGALQVADLVASVKGQQGTRHFEGKLSAPKIALTGDLLEGDAATFTAKVNEAQRTLAADLKLPAFAREGRRFRSGVAELALDFTQNNGTGKDTLKATVSAPLNGQLTADGRGLQSLDITLLTLKGSGTLQGQNIDMQLTSPLAVDMATRALSMPALKMGAQGRGERLPGGKLAVDLVGALQAGLRTEQVSLDLKGKVDTSQLAAHVSVKDFNAPRFKFDATVDTLNIDQYRHASTPALGDKSGRPGGGVPGTLDFSALRDLHGEGSVKIGRLVADGLTLAAVSADLRAAGGKLEVAPFSAAAFEGNVRGALTLDGSASTPAIALKTQASSIAIAPLLKHFAQSDTLEGRGSLNLDVTARGNTTAALRAALNGGGDILLVDGAIRGFNLAGTLREARGMLQQLRGEKSYRGSATEKTDFSELKGTFTIRDGVLQNRDLALKAPLLRAAGAGNVDLAHGTLDYTTRATLAATSKGQGGKEASELRGFTVPVRFTGPLSAPQYTIDFAGMAMDAARTEVESRVREALEKRLGGGATGDATQGTQPSKPADVLREGLRGLFGR